MSARDCRSKARRALRGKWGVMLPLMLLAEAIWLRFELRIIYQAFFSEARQINLPGGLVYKYLAPVGIGVLLFVLMYIIQAIGQMVGVGAYRAAGAVLDDERPNLGQLFPVKLFWKALAMNIVRGALIYLQLLLLIVPGFIASCRYCMADFLLASHPELGPIEALRESRRRMKGNKFAYFCLGCSFLGWTILCMGCNYLVYRLLRTNQNVGTILIYFAVCCLSLGALSCYTCVARTAFFRHVLKEGKVAVIRPQPEMTEEEYEAAPAGDPERRFTALSADETVAKDMFLQYGCSRNRMREDGVLEDYEGLNISLSSEVPWRREYGDQLMLRFDREPELFDELLALAAEYAIEELTDRMLHRIDRHIRQETLPDAEVLEMAGRVAAMLTSGTFADSEGFVGRKCAQISDMADRLEHRLAEREPDSDWRRTLELIRKVCGEA